MKFKFFISALALLAVVSLASSASTTGNFYFNNGTFDPGLGSCEEEWVGLWGDCVNGQQTFDCIQTNPDCHTIDKMPEQCLDIRECSSNNTNTGSSSSGSSGGSSSGSSSGSGDVIVKISDSTDEKDCAENWACYSWTNNIDSCGERECVDLNECGTEELKPEVTKECPEEEKSFFSALTGNVIGGISSFASSKTGAPLLLALIVVIVAIAYFGFRKRTSE